MCDEQKLYSDDYITKGQLDKIKSMTDEEVAKSVDLEVSDFDESGDMLEELRDIMEGAE